MPESPGQCRTDRPRCRRQHVVTAVAPIVLAVSAAVSGLAWPDFLEPATAYSAAEIAAVRRAWLTPTLHRTVEGPAAPMALASYLALVDNPDVIAAAGRHLGLAQYEVRMIGPDWYEADDDEGAHGVYRVLGRRDGCRVTLSWGQRRGAWLPTISGSALSVMRFEARGRHTSQRLDAYVVIDNAVLARLARSLVTLFGHVADRKLSEGFTVSAKVAAWAGERPQEFCAWLAEQPLDLARRHRLLDALPDCASDAQASRSPTR